MRLRNWPVITIGLVPLVAAIAFFCYFDAVAEQVHDGDPFQVMRTVRQISGIVGGPGVVLIVLGLIGKKA